MQKIPENLNFQTSSWTNARFIGVQKWRERWKNLPFEFEECDPQICGSFSGSSGSQMLDYSSKTDSSHGSRIPFKKMIRLCIKKVQNMIRGSFLADHTHSWFIILEISWFESLLICYPLLILVMEEKLCSITKSHPSRICESCFRYQFEGAVRLHYRFLFPSRLFYLIWELEQSK